MKITRSQLKQIIKEEISKVLTEQEELAPGVHLAPDGSYAKIVFKFDGMNFKGREEELEFPIRNVLNNNRIPPEEVVLNLEGDTFTMHTLPDPGEDTSEWASYVEGVYDEVHQELAEIFAQQEMDFASDRYDREERAIRRAGPKGPMSPEEHAKYMSLYDED